VSEQQPATIRVGEMIAGKYRVEKVLGVGGMGMVLAARHVELHELRAIKLMLSSLGACPEAVERFLREARAAVRLKSEHVAKVYDVGRLEDGSPYMVMEYLEGSDLAAILKAHGPMSVADAVTRVLEVCEGLAEAHAAGIIHRDLKPANLFLTRAADGSPSMKILDFGISKILPTAGNNPTFDMTTTGAVLGSPHYMSPEQMRSTRNVDARTDIWALGVILYKLTTGVVPFAAETLPQLCGMVFQQAAAPPSRRRAGLPAAFDAVVLRCLEKQPAQRYGDVAELAMALLPFGGEGARVSVDRINRTLGVTASRPGIGSSTVPMAAVTPVPVPAQLALPAPSAPISGGTAASWRFTGEGSAPRSPSSVKTALAAVLGASILSVGVVALVIHGRAPAPPSSSATAGAQSAANVPPATSDERPPLSAAEPVPEIVATTAPSAAPAGLESARPAHASSVAPPASAARPPSMTARPRVDGPIPRRAPKPPPVGKADCNPPFIVDAKGIKRAKPECL
jgi:eukaryotic-like serine/threonine-protein kinase